MELRHLRYFCVAAEEMHIGPAAEPPRLGLTISPSLLATADEVIE
jgi:DNA-binding transcriptional LysR family regulator